VVIDLGGIHDALTDTADLWNYIDRTDKNKEHHLTILYMERGAGKANCNMKFTLPNADVIKVVDDDVPDIPPEKPVDFTEKDVEYHKTAKLTGRTESIRSILTQVHLQPRRAQLKKYRQWMP